MARQFQLRKRPQDEVIYLFANTGQEHERTLQFVDKCDKQWGLNVVWVEAVTNAGRVACTHKVVDMSSASRNGEPFEEMIKKYGIPNKAYPHCTRELKLNAMSSYIRSIGWGDGEFYTAVGIRADEESRRSKKAVANQVVYPLLDWSPISKEDINDWWDEQDFELGLAEHEGNCTWCWKKSFKKLYRLAHEAPEIFEFPKRCEATYGLAGHNIDGTHRVFFRETTSTNQLMQLAGEVAYESLIRLTRTDADANQGCSESCDVMTADSENLNV
jgi:hypothetical protein